MSKGWFFWVELYLLRLSKANVKALSHVVPDFGVVTTKMSVSWAWKCF